MVMPWVTPEMPNIIYKISNNVNDKVYIGQTIDLKKRWQNHKHDSKRLNQTIYYAMRKYGVENFKIEIIHECNNEDELDEMEVKFIAEHNSYKNGYNMNIGGNVLRGKNNPMYGKPRSDEDKQKSRKKQSIGIWHTPFGDYISATQISKTTDFGYSTIHKWCKECDSIISNSSIGQCKYLKSLKKSPLNKTYRELGFWFEPA